MNKILKLLLLSLPIYGIADEDVVPTYKLNPSVVSASGFEQNVQDAPASISVISGSSLKTKNFFDLAGAVNGIPGVDIGTEMGKTGGGLNISIRGMPSDYTLIMMDGHRQDTGGNVATDNVGWSEAFSSFFPPTSAIERIEVIRGPMSTLYGSDAIGGIVNIILKKPNMEKFEGAANLSTTQNQHMEKYGSNYSQDLYLSMPIIENKLAFSLRTRVYYAAPWDTNVPYTKDGQTKIRTLESKTPVYIGLPTQTNLYSVGGRLAYQANDKNYFYADAQYFYNHYDNHEGQLGGPTSATPNYINTRANFIIAHEGSYDFGKWDNSIQYNNNANRSRVVGGKGADKYDNRRLEARDVIIDSKLVMPLGESWYVNNLTIGGRYWFEWMRDMLLTSQTVSENTGALFIEDEWDPLEVLSVTGGLRYDYNEVFGSNFSPRIYMAYTPVDFFTLKGGFSTGFKAPYINYLVNGEFGYGNQGTFPYIGNPDLKPEHSYNYEVSALFNFKPIQASLTYFVNDFRDKITRTNVEKDIDHPECYATNRTDSYCQTWVNQDEAVVQGVELYANTDSFWGFSLEGSYTFLYSKYLNGEFKDQPMVDTPKHQVYGKINYNYKDFNIYFQGNYKSERAILGTSSVVNGAKPSEIKDIIGSYKPYSVFDLVASYQFSKNLKGNFGIYNLFDKNFQDYVYIKSSRGHDVIANQYNVTLEGRRFWISLNMDF